MKPLKIRGKSLFAEIMARAGKEIESLYDINNSAVAYVGTFWLFYSDYSVIYPPAFALNFEEYIDKTRPEDKWSPPDWKYSVVQRISDSLKPLYENLTELLLHENEDIWDFVIEENYELYCELSKTLTRKARSNEGGFIQWNKAENFVVLILEQRDGEEFYNERVKDSVEPQILNQLEDVLFVL